MKRYLPAILTLGLLAACLPISLFMLNPEDVNPAHREAFLPAAPEGLDWELVFNDDFDGDTLDDTKWEAAGDWPRKGGYWVKDAVTLDGEGNLEILTYEKDGKYYDGCVRTRDRFEKTYGFFTTRVQLQREEGHWPAFWLFTDAEGSLEEKGLWGGVDGTEIDIFEKFTLNAQVQQTLHWDGYDKDHRFSERQIFYPGIMEGWHTYSLLWTPDEYVFYIDGVETWRNNYGGVCQVPVYMKLSDEIGELGGDITKANLPDSFKVDYVRVYDLVDPETGAVAW